MKCLWEYLITLCVILAPTGSRSIHQENEMAPTTSISDNETKITKMTTREKNINLVTNNFHEINQKDITNRNFSFKNRKEDFCDEEIFLLIVVCSAVNHFEHRTTIRETWGSADNMSNTQTKVIFFVGQGHEDDIELQKAVDQEDTLHRDIIQVNVFDDYANLTLKSLAFLQWIDTYCKNAKFILKTDDDSLINVKVLLKDLHNTIHSRFIMGHIIGGAQPIRDKLSKYYTPESVYNKSMYPDYHSGSGYILSGDVIHDLYQTSKEVELFWLEDVFITGMCAKRTKVKQIFNSKFGFQKRGSNPCDYRNVIVGHELSPFEMKKIWTALTSPDLNCDIQIGKAYIVD